MIDFKSAFEIRDLSNGKLIDKIEDADRRIIYEAWREVHAEGTPPLILSKSKGEDLLGYKIYGNCVQNGIPTPTAHVEVQSVGEKTKNLFNGGYESYFELNLSKGDSLTVSLGAGSSSGIFLLLCNSEKTELQRISVNETVDGRISSSFTVEHDDVRYVFFTGTAGSVDFTYPQIEYGEIATYYEPYGYKIPVTVSDGEQVHSVTNIYLSEPLRKIGDHSDYIDFASGKVVRNISHRVFTSEDIFTLYSQTNICFWIIISDSMLGSSMSLCSHFKNELNVWSNAKLTDCYSDHPTLPRKYFRPLDPSIVTGDDFNNFIIGEYEKGTPVTFDYVLAVPKEETLTLVSIPTLKGYTVLDANTQTDPSNMEISYIGK